MCVLFRLTSLYDFHCKVVYLIDMSNKHKGRSPAHSSQHEEEAKAYYCHIAKEEAALHEA